MKKLTIFFVAALMLGACAKKNDSGEREYETYKITLTDSVQIISNEMDSCNEVATTLKDKIGSLLPEFRAVNNSREVEGYMIFQGWENRYPLQSTGVVARLSESRQLELVAALKGGEFDRIRVNAPSVSAETAVVPYDQALNYRRDGLNTVLFTGPEADKVANLIADNELNPITVTFLNGGKQTGTWRMDHDNAKMITMTYLLYSANKEHKELEVRLLKLGEKRKLLRQHRELMNLMRDPRRERGHR
ncbi:MAG: hypothetical protein K2K81_04455 [Muribaculaceae bacterium]|nr:hypothetical protein [Muribaculaceae bacterium]MDE6682056.1 hypothetical protein [Muribaculaceae bacterium]